MGLLDRTFEAIVFDWDGTAVPDRRASARAVRHRVEQLCAHGVDIAVVSGTHLGNVDGQLRARPSGPGRLFMALNRGSELFQVGPDGPRLVWKRHASAAEEAALDRAAALMVERLAARGLHAEVVSVRVNRRKIDVIPLPDWADPPKARIDELVVAVTERLRAAGIADLASVVDLAVLTGKEAGLDDPRVTSDAKHVEIGLTDKSDSMRLLLQELGRRGVTAGLVLVAGDEFGRLGGCLGSDAFLLPPNEPRLTAVSVGVEPTGVPPGVLHLPGGPATFRALLDEQLRRRAHGRVPQIDEDPEWVLPVDGDPLRPRVDEALLSLGDGVIGVRGSREEPDPHEVPLLLAAGVYTGEGSAARLLAGPWPLGLEVTASREGERRLLDLRSGLLLREAGDGLRTLRFVAAGRRGVVALRAEAAPGRLRAGPPLRLPADAGIASDGADGEAWARTTGTYGGIGAVAGQRTAVRGGLRTVERVAAYVADGRRPPSLSRASAGLRQLEHLGFERLLDTHRTAWAERWANTGVWIPDDPQAQLAARFALFHLWNSAAPAGEAPVGARGLSGPGYAGHVFWDADVFVLPAMASMTPSAARGMLDYRLRRLPQALAAAGRDGRAGARFPWESASLGDDVTPTTARVNGAWEPIRTGQLEEHVVADIAWAAGHYADWTGDRAFLTGRGRQLLTETARYWATRCTRDADGRAHLRHVIGPDEYHEDVDDNAFTNLLARWNLRRAAALEPPSPETAHWLRLADALVDGYDASTGRHEQFAGYSDLEPLLATDIGTPPLAAELLLGVDRLSRTQIVKQPDVLMAHHLIPEDLPSGSLVADLDHYLPRTSHGSSLSPAIAASLLARAGRPDEALALLDIALRMDLDDITGMTSAGLHLATMGGVWQALLMGFAGVRVSHGALLVDPHLPQRWSSGLTLRFRCLGQTVDLHLLPDSARVTAGGGLRVGTPSSPPGVASRDVHLTRTDDTWVVNR